MKLNDTPRTLHELLHYIVEEFGEAVLTESRLKGLLGDLGCGVADKYRHVIGRSVNDRLGQKILLLRELDDADFSLKLGNIKQSFQEENFFRHDIVDYIVDSYLFALGWIDAPEEYDEDANEGNGKAGELSFAERSGSEYCGNLNPDNQRSGFGIAKNEDGGYYAGEWKLDMKNGLGMHVEPGQNKYAGEWRLNRRAGVGIQILPNGMRYAGEWKNGKMNGHGILFFPNGERICALFRNGQPDASQTGFYYLKDGSFIGGRITIDGPDGPCTRYHTDGSCTKESWDNGNLIT